MNRVSVLFSEPKIPQSHTRRSRAGSPSVFQCSSASRKFLNMIWAAGVPCRPCSFSALQRAENSSIRRGGAILPRLPRFQCSSASRKFLNSLESRRRLARRVAFQCSSASRKFLNRRSATAHHRRALRCFSALQRAENSSIDRQRQRGERVQRRFSALQRAENSSIRRHVPASRARTTFQCSSASRKFLNGVRLL